MRVYIPNRFHQDRAERGLDSGQLISQLPSGVTVEMNPEQLAEYISDARHYGAPVCGVDQCPSGVRSSARAAYKWLDVARLL